MKTSMKRLFSLVAATLLTTTQLFAQIDNVIDEVLWVVGDEAILRSEVETEESVCSIRAKRSMVTRML